MSLEISYQDLIAAQQQVKVAQRQLRLMLNAAGYEEFEYNFINGRIVIAIHSEYADSHSSSVTHWRSLVEWCGERPDWAYFILEGRL